MKCEICQNSINIFEYMSLSSNPRYEDEDVYIVHIDCEPKTGEISKIIEVFGSLKLVEVSWL